MATPNLAIAHIAASQNQKEVTANAAFDGLDSALCGQLSVANGNADQTLTAAQALGNLVIVVTGALTAGRNLIVPVNKKLYIVKNATSGGFSLTVKTPAGTGFAIAAADGLRLVYCDGVNVSHVT